MLKDKLDKYFKEELESNPQWNKEALWNDIESKMDAPKKRRRFIMLFILGMALLGLIIIIDSYNNSHIDIQDKAEDFATTSKSKITKAIINTNDISNDFEDNEVLDEQVVVVNGSIKGTGTIKPNSIKHLEQIKTVIQDFEQMDVKSDLVQKQILNPNNKVELSADKVNAMIDESSELISKQVSDLEFLAGLGLIKIDRHQTEVKLDMKLVKTPKRAKVVDDKYIWHQLESFAGIGLAIRTLDAQSESSSTIVNARLTNETTLEKRSFGLLFRKGIRQNWHLSTGLQYNEQYERLNLAFTDQSIESRKKMDAYVYTGVNGISSFIEGDVDVTISQDFDIQHYNVLRSIDIPLLLGYHIQRSKLGFMLEAGPSINIVQSFSGRIFDLENVESNSKEIYKNRTGLKAQTRVGVQYFISKGLSINSGFIYTKQFGSSVEANQNYGLSYSDLSFNIGVSIQF